MINESCPPLEYSLADQNGLPVTLESMANLERVHTVELEWPDGFRIKHRLRDRKNLGILIGG